MATPVTDESLTSSKRPSNSAFKQQKLPAWQPILTAGTVLPTFFVIGLAFIPIGIGLLVSSNEVKEYQLDYTFCKTRNGGDTCASIIARNISEQCICHIEFNLTEDFEAPVFLYYGLSNYYQNHRRYVKSRSDRQLLGNLGDLGDCEPFRAAWYTNGTVLPIAPCGAIANSLFNDTMELFQIIHGEQYNPVPLLKTGIAWYTDKNVKFRNPAGNVTTGEAFKNTMQPPYWRRPVWQLDTSDANNNGLQNEDLIVWMRTAALPIFRKLFRRVNHRTEGFKNKLSHGPYVMLIDYAYPVTSFRGTKRFILSNTSWLGGKNPFLGIAYIVVGNVCLVLAVVFLVIHKKYGKSNRDLITINQRTPY